MSMILEPCLFFVLSVLTSTSATDVGEPVILTSLLAQGKYKEAQEVSRVSPDIGNITSYSGFFTVDKRCESNLFFWFIPAQNRSWEEAPVLLWQQGGPGSSSLFGLFEEVGPFKHSNISGLVERQYSWSIENNLLIIDTPAGVGFSFTGKQCYHDNEIAIAEDWYKALIQFYQLFPELKNNALVISGQSYAGHYIPLYGYTIHKNNPTADVKVNLTAMLILSAWSDPIKQIHYGPLYYQLGLIDDRQRDIYYDYQQQCMISIKNEDWENAYHNCSAMTSSLYNKFVGDVNIYNLLTPEISSDEQTWDDFIQTDEVRKQLHVGNLSYNTLSRDVLKALRHSLVKSVKPYVQQLLEHYTFLFVNGQFDLICPYTLTVNFLRSMKWSGETSYLQANRTQWCFEEDQMGYYKGVDRLYDILVQRAGHYIPKDNPPLAYLLVNSVTSGSPRHPLHALQDCEDV